MQFTPMFFLGKPHGQKSLAGYSTWGHKELETTEELSTRTFGKRGLDGAGKKSLY